MKRPRRLAFWLLLIALVTILAAGFYLGATHQETRPADTDSPATTSPQD